ncbi:hypothetical protein BH10BAC5_BH10BAC5_06030 [soil metagenome]
MENELKLPFALDRYIDLKASDNFNGDLIFTKLQELSALRKDNLADIELEQWTKEFKNLGMKTRYVLKKIQKMKFRKIGYRKLRFSDFLKEEEYPEINYELLKMEAESLLKDFLQDYWVAKEAKNFADLIYSSLNPDDSDYPVIN